MLNCKSITVRAESMDKRRLSNKHAWLFLLLAAAQFYWQGCSQLQSIEFGQQGGGMDAGTSVENRCTEDIHRICTGAGVDVSLSQDAAIKLNDQDATTCSGEPNGQPCGPGSACQLGNCIAVAGAPPTVYLKGGIVPVGCVPGDQLCGSFGAVTHLITVSSFEAGKHEVTVKEYQDCVALGRCTEVELVSDKCNHEGNSADHPITCVTWSQARAFCQSMIVNGDLPTSDQWERMARANCLGATDFACMKLYVWGDQWPPPPKSANLYDDSCQSLSSLTPGYDDGFCDVSPVEAMLPTSEGIFGLGGNVFEFILDYDGIGGKTSNRPGSRGERFCWARDNAYTLDAGPEDARVSTKTPLACEKPWINVGFRCVRN